MTAFARGPHQQAILRLLADGRGRTANQIATKLDHSFPSTCDRLRGMSDRWPALVEPHPSKPPKRGRIWKITPLGRDYLKRLEPTP